MIPLAMVASLTYCSFDYTDKYGVLIKFGEFPKPPSNAKKADWWAFHTRYGPQPIWDQQMWVAPPLREHRIDGTVLDVSDKFIEVKPKDGGEVKKFTPHTLLATGRLPIWERSDCRCYMLEDVRKGDEVSVGFGTVVPADGEQAFFVMILKRPGGKLPPTRKITLDHPYHTDQQAINDYEEFGTPLPKHLQKKAQYLKAPAVVPPLATDPKKKD